jgi:hypothetical protein
MYRRRRPHREIAFSFDSFLDVVANVCGIIIRFILVAWVGGRSYHALSAKQALEPAPVTTEVAAGKPARFLAPPVTDPLEAELARHRDELAEHQQRLLEQLRQCELLETTNSETTKELASLSASEIAVQQERGQLERALADKTGATQSAQLSLAELEKRSQQLAAELKALEQLPPLKKTLRYRTPVSRPVHTEELHFECQDGRVCFIDLQAFLIEIRRGLDDQAEQLKSRWQVEGTAGPVGAYRLRYTVERERGLLDGGGLPGGGGGFRYGMSGWVVEPIASARGETASAALAPGGEFRRLVDAIDPDQTVVTMWVYPDSFALYRQLRDFLHERNIEVAGRPLPPGMPIASSRKGSASRGQ